MTKTVKRMITIPEKLNEQLKESPNASALITLLLENHFLGGDDSKQFDNINAIVRLVKDMKVSIGEMYEMVEIINKRVDEVTSR